MPGPEARPRGRLARWLVLTVCVGTLLAGCLRFVTEGPGTVEGAAALEGTLPVLEQYQVQLFQDDGCRALEIPEGRYSSGQPPEWCGLFTSGDPGPFDEHASRVFDEVRAALNGTGVSVSYAWFLYDRDGHISSGIFEVGCASPCEFARYIFERGGIRPNPDRLEVPGATTFPLGDEWVWHSEN